MKRTIALLLVLFCLLPCALADVDLSGMTFEELMELREQVNQALWASDDWQSVTVPQGVYLVGRDIPAGTWTVECADINRYNIWMLYTRISWGEYLDDTAHEIAPKGRNDRSVQVYNPKSEKYSVGFMTQYTFTVQSGDYIVIDAVRAPAVFTPYIGAPDLGFDME